MICLFTATAAVVYTLAAEIPSLRLRAKTQSIAFTVNNFISLATTLVVPYVFQSPGYLGAKTAREFQLECSKNFISLHVLISLNVLHSVIFCGTLICAIIWAYFYVPETNKRSPTEMDALFAAKVPARKFATTDAQALASAPSSTHV